MYLVKFLDKISSFYVDKTLVTFSLNGELSHFNLKLEKKWSTNPNTQHLAFLFDHYVIVYTQYKIIKSLDAETGQVDKELRGDIYPFTKVASKIYIEHFQNNELFFSILNADTFIIDKRFPLNGNRIKHVSDSNFVIAGKTSILTIYDWDNPSQNYSLDLSKVTGSRNLKIAKNIQQIQNHVYLYIYDEKQQDAKMVIALNTKTKSIDKVFPTFTGSIKKSDGLLYTSHEKSLQILDPETFAIREIDLVPELSKHGFKRMDYEKWFVEDKRLYFAQNIGAHNAKIGVFDLESEKMIDSVDLAKENGTIGTLKKRANRLYVHTQDRTLHVYDLGESPT